MAISLKAVILKHKPHKDGGCPIYVRLTMKDPVTGKSKIKYFPAGYSIIPASFDEFKGLVIKNSNADYLNIQIQKKLNEIQRKALEFEINHPQAGIKALTTYIEGSSKLKQSFFEFADNDLKRFSVDEMQYRGIKSVVNHFKSFAGDDLLISRVTPTLLKQYQSFMNSNGLAGSTQRHKLSRVRALINAAIRERLLPVNDNPFIGFKMPKVTEKPIHRLTIDEIRKIEAFNPIPDSWEFHARNVFLFQFYNQGMRIGDAIMLKWERIIEGRLMYNMGKSQKLKGIPLSEKSLKILDYYRGLNPVFVFNMINPKSKSPVRRQADTAATMLNRNLKVIGRLLEINKPMNMHLARHSFAKYADDSGIDRKYIQEFLNHSKAGETARYLDRIQDDDLDKEFGKLKF